MEAPVSTDEVQRLEALRECQVLDTAAEAAFDEITSLAAALLRMPISLVSFIDETRQWFKSRHGLDVDHTPRTISFCAHAILEAGIFEIPDASTDPRFSGNPLVTESPHIRFYAGMPLLTSDGQALGTLNVIDTVPRRLSVLDKRILEVLGKQVSTLLELRRAAHRMRAEVTERQASENRLREAYEQVIRDLEEAKRFSDQVTQVMPSVVYVYDLVERRCVFTNRAVALALGHEVPEVTSDNDPISRFMHPDDQAGFADHLSRVTGLQGHETAELTYRMQHSDGHWRWFQGCDAVLDRDTDGKVRRIVGTATDITAIKQAELANKASEQRLRALAESSAVGIATADMSGLLRYINERASDIVGQPAEDCLGRGWQRSLHPDDRDRVLAGWAAAIADAVPRQAEFRFLRGDGTETHVLAECRPLVETGVDQAAFVITMVDVTASRQVEQHRLARAAAEQANRAKSQFLARMSHEFRTPLNAVLGFAQLMQIENGARDPRTGERIGQIVRAGEWLLSLVNETLNLARIEAGVVELHIKRVALGPLVRGCLELVGESARQMELSIDNRIEPDGGPQVWADAVRCKEILINLLSNAIKYNRRGGAVIVHAREEGGVVRVGVQDTGNGIPPEQLPMLFQPFNRLGADRTDIAGSGLGLAISKRLAGLMDGELSAQSDVGVGTTFLLTLPIEAEREDSVWAVLPA